MPEGHTIHRAVQDQIPMLVEKKIFATSPQGRFSEGAAQISGNRCAGIEAVGKHLLYHFENGLCIHIHLGLAGKIYRNAQPADPPRDVVRIRMESASHVVDITGPAICEILDTRQTSTFRGRYGPDILAKNPEPERAIEKIRNSRSSIATLLMNQKVISGIGNIYRTEILWLLNINPMTRGSDLSPAQVRAIWDDMRALMQIGVEHNSIITNGNIPRSGKPVGERVNIYHQSNCPRCETEIIVSKVAARTLYHCPTCQRASSG